MEKAIKLTNPKKEVKYFTHTEFWGFQEEVTRCKSFIEWAEKNNVCSHYNHFGKTRLNTKVIETFLKEKGYSCIDETIQE